MLLSVTIIIALVILFSHHITENHLDHNLSSSKVLKKKFKEIKNLSFE